MRKVKTIVFDIGRVLVTISLTGEKFGRLMRAIGVPPEEALSKFWYTNEVRRHMTGELTPEEFYQVVVARFKITLTFGEFVEGWNDLFAPMPGMEEVFAELGSEYRLGILSDTDPLHWRRIREMLPWLDTVKKPTLSFELGLLKPHPGMFDAAAANGGCEKHECLFIDDALANVDGARYYGMPALMFTDAEKLRKDLGGLKLL